MRLFRYVPVCVSIWGCSRSIAEPSRESDPQVKDVSTGRRAPSSRFPAAPAGVVYSTPRDVSSDVGATAIEIVLDQQNRVVAPATAESVRSLIELRSYPALSSISATASVVAAPDNDFSPRKISIVPNAGLQDGWYVLALSSAVPGVQVGAQRDVFNVPNAIAR